MNPLFAIIIPALIAVESGGDDHARGEHGELGCLQIKRVAIDDVNRIQRVIRFEHRDAFSRARSIAIFEIYIIWHCGPTGYLNQDRDGYWQRVKNLVSAEAGK